MRCHPDVLVYRAIERPYSVDTDGGLKDGKLRGKDYLNSRQDSDITFRSTKIIQTGPTTFELDGDFTIREVTKKEKLLLNDSGKGTPTGTIIGTMGFDRKDERLRAVDTPLAVDYGLM
jgi:polyisoprenoid-binding protein YceI